MEKTSNMTKKARATHNIEEETEGMADTLLAVMDKLSDKESEIKLSFKDLTCEVGMVKARLNGAVALEIIYAKDAE